MKNTFTLDAKPCRLCLSQKPLCRSHIIPEFCFHDFYDKNRHFIVMPDVKRGIVHKGDSGYRERLLCKECETKLNTYERHSRRLFRDDLPPHVRQTSPMREFPNLDYKLLKLFFLSVLWRASVSRLPVFEHVRLGPHEEKVREMVRNGEAGKADDYPTLFLILHLGGKHFCDFMVEPTYFRADGRKCYRFLLNGFVVFIFVSGQHAPEPFP